MKKINLRKATFRQQLNPSKGEPFVFDPPREVFFHCWAHEEIFINEQCVTQTYGIVEDLINGRIYKASLNGFCFLVK